MMCTAGVRGIAQTCVHICKPPNREKTARASVSLEISTSEHFCLAISASEHFSLEISDF